MKKIAVTLCALFTFNSSIIFNTLQKPFSSIIVPLSTAPAGVGCGFFVPLISIVLNIDGHPERQN